MSILGKLGYSLIVALIGLFIVFLGLIILIGCIKVMSAVVGKMRENAEVFKALAQAYSGKGSHLQAVEHYNRYLSTLSSPKAEDYTGLADIYQSIAADENTGEAETKEALRKADEAYAKVCEMNPTATFYVYKRAQINAQLDPENKEGLAKPYYERLITMVQDGTQGENDAVYLKSLCVVLDAGVIGISGTLYGILCADQVACLQLFIDGIGLTCGDERLKLDEVAADVAVLTLVVLPCGHGEQNFFTAVLVVAEYGVSYKTSLGNAVISLVDHLSQRSFS